MMIKINKDVLIYYLVIAILILPGCSLFTGSMQPLTVTATDPTAEISIDGLPVGQGVVVTNVKRNRSHAIMAKTKDGRVGGVSVGTKISTTGILDIVGGVLFLLPLLGLLGPGFWDLDQDQVIVVVPPSN
jgi:hypothetical protein